MNFSFSRISRFGSLLHNYPHSLFHLLLLLHQSTSYVVLFLPIVFVEGGVGENFTSTPLTWNSNLKQAEENNGHLIKFNGSIVSCLDDNWNGICGVNGTQTQRNESSILAGVTPTSPVEDDDGAGGLQSAVDFGIHLSFRECQLRFKWSRWNCSENYWQANTGTKENAYVTAINAAAVTYSIAKACARGDIPNCGCAPPTTISLGRSGSIGDDPNHPHQHQGGYWRWGGCSADVDFAVKLARRSTATSSTVKKVSRRKHKHGQTAFNNEIEIDKDVLQAVSTHNKRVGRNMVQTSLDTDCKCHGVSGSCTLKTCWMKLPQFVKIGRIVYNLYKKSSLVNDSEGGKRMRYAQKQGFNSSAPAKRRIFLQLLSADGRNSGGGKPSRTQLVHVIPSPTYCDPEGLHSGTRGRRCLRSSGEESLTSTGSSIINIDNEEGSCSILCCGRGYNTHVTWRRWKCRCVFKWCCTVDCEDCEERVQIYTCN